MTYSTENIRKLESQFTKFPDETAEKLNAIALDGMMEDQRGSVTEDGLWQALLIDTDISGAPNAILQEDSQGFVDYVTYESKEEARSMWSDNLWLL